MSSSAAFMTQFRAAVLAHLKRHVSEEDWARFRKLATEGIACDATKKRLPIGSSYRRSIVSVNSQRRVRWTRHLIVLCPY